MDDIIQNPQKRSWDRPDGMSFEGWMKSRIARASERAYDWNALKFQADFDPKYRRRARASIQHGHKVVGRDRECPLWVIRDLAGQGRRS